MTELPVLSARELTLSNRDDSVRLLDGVSFDVFANEVLCIVGESGSGKSLSMSACMGMLPENLELQYGTIAFNGADLGQMTERQRSALRGTGMAMVFQDPLSALNPLMRVGAQIEETIRLHRPDMDRKARRERVHDLLQAVHIANPEARARAYPHELSGGMRQRVMIAMATAHSPRLLIADEPTTALDVTVQAQILGLLAEMRRRSGGAQVLITHDLGVVAQTADRVAVLYSGRIVEIAPVQDLFRAPAHPYTIGLLASLLRPNQKRAYAIPGQPPLPAERPSGCAFRNRCPIGRERTVCAHDVPTLLGADPKHQTACFFPIEARALAREKA